MSHSLSDGENVMLGITAAFIEAVILQPTLYFKNAQAQRLPLSFNPRIIYRGTAASIFNEMQMMGLQFGTTSLFRRLYNTTPDTTASSKSKKSKGNNISELLAAASGGFFTAIFVSPIELIMIQQQRFGGSFIAVPNVVRKKYGIGAKGMMRGLMPCMLRDSIYVLGMLGVTPLVQGYLMKNYKYSENIAGLYGSLVGGVVAAIPSHPLDIIKTCMQGDIDQVNYKSFRETAVTIWGEGGIKRVFAGCFWRSFNIIATIYIANFCSNSLAPVMFSSKF